MRGGLRFVVVPGLPAAGVVAALFAVVALPALRPTPLAAQGPWRAGGRAGVLLRLDRNFSGPGLDVGAVVGRSQTPGVRIRARAGLLWFPGGDDVRRFVGPGGEPVTETRSDELAGPYLALGAARPLPAGDPRVLLVAEIGVGVLREERTRTSTDPTVARPYHFVDWEVTPTWTLGATVLLPAWEGHGIRPEVDSRITVITLADDDFIPTLAVGVGWSRIR